MQEKTLFKIVLEMKMLSEIMFGFFVCVVVFQILNIWWVLLLLLLKR
jgi:hypothetical protein